MANGSFGRYVDKGKPHPTHHEWADYLKWVALKSEIKLRPERVIEFGPAKGSSFFVKSIREREIQIDCFME